jgi:very-short-patch-repair endonuclease
VPIGPYIADFVSFSARLIVEVDGGQHAESIKDQRRDQWLGHEDFRIVRYWNNEVLGNPDGVLTDLVSRLNQK